MVEIFGAQKRCTMNGFFEIYRIWFVTLYGLKCSKFSEHKNGCDWAYHGFFGQKDLSAYYGAKGVDLSEHKTYCYHKTQKQ